MNQIRATKEEDMDIILKTAKWIVFAYGTNDYDDQIGAYADYLSFILNEKKEVIREVLTTTINTLNKYHK